jgi:hypothetical protein
LCRYRRHRTAARRAGRCGAFTGIRPRRGTIIRSVSTLSPATTPLYLHVAHPRLLARLTICSGSCKAQRQRWSTSPIFLSSRRSTRVRWSTFCSHFSLLCCRLPCCHRALNISVRV